MSGGWRPPPFPFEIEDRGEIWIDESCFLGNPIELDLIFLSNRTESEFKKKKKNWIEPDFMYFYFILRNRTMSNSTFEKAWTSCILILWEKRMDYKTFPVFISQTNKI